MKISSEGKGCSEILIPGAPIASIFLVLLVSIERVAIAVNALWRIVMFPLPMLLMSQCKGSCWASIANRGSNCIVIYLFRRNDEDVLWRQGMFWDSHAWCTYSIHFLVLVVSIECIAVAVNVLCWIVVVSLSILLMSQYYVLVFRAVL